MTADYGECEIFVMPMFGIVLLFVCLNRWGRHPKAEPIMWTLLCNQFFSPYGFMFDQVVIIVVQAFIVSKAAARGLEVKWTGLILIANLLAFMPWLSQSQVGTYFFGLPIPPP